MGARSLKVTEDQAEGRKGENEGGKLQGRYPEEDTDQYTVYSIQ